MADIVLTTLNAKYPHAAFGLRYLMANLSSPLRERAAILEFDINQPPLDVLEILLAQNPKIVGVGIYIWNVTPATQLVQELKRLRPEIVVVLGGPEVSYETDSQPIVAAADYVITGEADIAFGELCEKILANRRPLQKIITPDLPDFSKIALPYELYSDHDIAHRVVYVEASRGCPFKCEFCLSSLDVPVRNVPLDAFLAAMQKLLDRGCRRFKFVDRTFNLNLNFSKAIVQFFLDRYTPDLFLHFEMIPDRLPEPLRDLIAKFPPVALQFEVGVQTFNDHVATLISRRQDNHKLEENLKFLHENTGVHVHADLIVGLPGEDVASFAAGFDRLVAMNPQEIQVGMLKRLRGTPIIRHDVEWGMVYSSHPPYEIQSTKLVDAETMIRLRRFAKFWDLIANSGNFISSTPMIWEAFPPLPLGEGRGEGLTKIVDEDKNANEDSFQSLTPTLSQRERGQEKASPFMSFLALADWLFTQTGKTYGIALPTLVDLVFKFLTDVKKLDAQAVATTLAADYRRGGRHDLPASLKPFVADDPSLRRERFAKLPRRQARHLSREAE